MKKLKAAFIGEPARYAKGITIKPACIIIEGDIVVLNSGAPKMTVETIIGDFVKCVWYCDDGKAFKSANFHKACLNKQG